MQRKLFVALALAFATVIGAYALPAFGRAGMSWKLLNPTALAGVTTQIRVQLIDGAGKPVTHAIAVSSVRVDMGPDNMADMTAPAKVLPSKAPGVVVIETNLYAPGRWAIILSATVDGKNVNGSVTITAVQKSAEAALPPPVPSRKILYYRNPTGLADTSPTPKKDAMGMDYIPVTSDDISKVPGAVHLTTEKIQRAGVRTELVTLKALAKEVRATGTVAADENRQAILTARFDGFVEKLFVSQTGDKVRAGQPLMRVWIQSPDVLVKEADYIGSLASHSDVYAAQAAAVLRQYGVPQSEIDAMRRSGNPKRVITITAPQSGTVMEKPVVTGMHFSAGDTLFKTTDVSNLWVLAEVSERDLAALHPGQSAEIAFRDNPDASFAGKVSFIYPELDPVTRTVKVRITVANAKDALRIGQYADVKIAAPVASAPVLTVPASAVIDDGTRTVAFVALPGGLFEPRNLKLGARSGDLVEVRSGLSKGDRIVTSGNFLIDAESNLQTAMQSFAPAGNRK